LWIDFWNDSYGFSIFNDDKYDEITELNNGPVGGGQGAQVPIPRKFYHYVNMPTALDLKT